MKKVINILYLSTISSSAFASGFPIESAYDIPEGWPEKRIGDYGLVKYSESEFEDKTKLSTGFSQEDATKFVIDSLATGDVHVTNDQLITGNISHSAVSKQILNDGFAIYYTDDYEDVTWYVSIDENKNIVSVYIDVDYSDFEFPYTRLRQDDDWVLSCFFAGKLSGQCSRQYDAD